ncbi:ribonuclease H-like domain-containing protein [Tanacetum coccineum]
MTGPDNTNTTLLSDKLSLVTHHHLLTRVPVKLEFDDWNYGSWEFFFDQLCDSYDVSKYIHGNPSGTATSNPPPLTPEELKEAWDFISDLVEDNKHSRTSPLKAELRSVKLGDLSMEAYFQKIESLMTILASLDSPVSDEDVVHYVIDGLPEKYNQMRLKTIPEDSSSSSPMVLLAESSTSRRPSNPQVKSLRPCFNFAKGSCRYGSDCRYLHDATSKPAASSSRHSSHTTEALLIKLLDKLGVNDIGQTRVSNNNTTTTTPIAYTATANPVPVHYSAQSHNPHSAQQVITPPTQYAAQTILPQPAQYVPPPPGFTYLPTVAQQAAQPSHVQPQPAHGSSATPGLMDNTSQATLLPQAFTTGTLHDPATGNWNMDTGASSHLNNSVTSLNTIFNSCMYPSVSVGDGHSIPVTNSGHSILPTTSRSLHLHNVLITPHIVKNLIYVRQFVRDNNCTIEFDSFGFSVKDFLTRRVLLRCDSTGDLYPVTSPSPIPHAFLVSQHTWHQRLGHPGSEVLRRLVSSKSISCSKEKPPVLCHACQLGKHVRLPFVSSNNVVHSCFDIIHSDVWTSPISSLSGFKYYVLFLDHYSQFCWVYPLLRKSDVLSKFVLFRKFVHTQFNCEIKSFQCDHGGEFDNRALHKLFVENGIQFRFSCAHTSQQNGHASNHRGYRCFNLNTKQIFISRHVTFDETVFRYGTVTNTTPTQYSFLDDSPDIPQIIPPTIPTVPPTATILPTTSALPLASTHGPTSPSPLNSPAAQHPTSPPTTQKTPLHHAPPTTPPVALFPSMPHSPSAQTPVAAQSTPQSQSTAGSTISIIPDPPNNPTRYKARLVANGSTQIEGVDVDETFSLVVKPAVSLWAQASPTSLGTDTAYLLLYVDDIVLTASSETLLQQKYTVEILERAGMVNCNPCRTPVDTESKLGDTGDIVSDPTLYRSLVGSLQYLTFTRPDISYAVQVCLHMHDLREPHFSALKQILRYIRGSLDYGLQLFSSSTTDLVAYVDADLAGCPTTRRSTAGYCMFLGNNLLFCSSKRQPTLSRSSAEAEYRGVANAVAETCWIRNLLRELHSLLSSATLVYCDNVSAVYLSCNPVQHQRIKHIKIDIHFVRDLVAAGQVRVLHVPSHYQFADIFTKGLPSTLFEEFRSSLSVRCPPALTAGEC